MKCRHHIWEPYADVHAIRHNTTSDHFFNHGLQQQHPKDMPKTLQYTFFFLSCRLCSALTNRCSTIKATHHIEPHHFSTACKLIALLETNQTELEKKNTLSLFSLLAIRTFTLMKYYPASSDIVLFPEVHYIFLNNCS